MAEIGIQTTCFSGYDFIDAPNASFPFSAHRSNSVDSNNVLTFLPSISGGSYNALNVLYRMPISKTVCGGSCSGSMNVTISTIGLGLFFGLTDGFKTVLAQASYPSGNYQLLYGIDKTSHISPNYIGENIVFLEIEYVVAVHYRFTRF